MKISLPEQPCEHYLELIFDYDGNGFMVCPTCGKSRPATVREVNDFMALRDLLVGTSPIIYGEDDGNVIL